jgi:hypothetical protein
MFAASEKRKMMATTAFVADDETIIRMDIEEELADNVYLSLVKQQTGMILLNVVGLPMSMWL